MNWKHYLAILALTAVGHSDWASDKEAAFLYVMAFAVYAATKIEDLEQRVSSLEVKE